MVGVRRRLRWLAGPSADGSDDYPILTVSTAGNIVFLALLFFKSTFPREPYIALFAVLLFAPPVAFGYAQRPFPVGIGVGSWPVFSLIVDAEFHRKHGYVEYLVREGTTDIEQLFGFLSDLRTDEAATVERIDSRHGAATHAEKDTSRRLFNRGDFQHTPFDNQPAQHSDRQTVLQRNPIGLPVITADAGYGAAFIRGLLREKCKRVLVYNSVAQIYPVH